uniref:Glycosyltransferase family 92 protein n=1 Tax=Strongyloides venezuelensis TaxID=75913 RepID=A0A0K0ETT7_STRVS
LIIINFQIIEKETSPNIKEYFIYGFGFGKSTKCEWNSYHISFPIPSNIVNDISNVTIFNLHTLTKHYVKIKRLFNKKKNKDDFTIYVMILLKYYPSNGIVTLIPYKSLPKSDIANPNKSIYRYGHLAAINICLHRRYSKYSTVLDVDEFLFINNIIVYSDKTFFEHIYDLLK